MTPWVYIKSVSAWGSETYLSELKTELESIPINDYPLQAVSQLTGYVDESAYEISILHSHANQSQIEHRIGLFYAELLSGCNCHDDPVAIPAYCEFQLTIQKVDGQASLTLHSQTA